MLTFFLKILGHNGLLGRGNETERLRSRWAKQSSHIVTNTLKFLKELGHPIKKPASETTYFKLLVLAFRVFEFQRSKVENREEVRS